MNSRMVNFAAAFIVLALSVYTLSIGSSILIPFVTAIVVWYIIISLANFYEKLHVGSVSLPRFFAMLFAMITTYIFLHFFSVLIAKSIYSIANEAPLYQAKLRELINLINQKMQLNLNLHQIISKINFSSLFTNFAVALTGIAQNFFVIVIYVLFLLLEYGSFDKKIHRLFPDKDKYNSAISLLDNIKTDINTYFKIKTSMSLATGVLSYLVLTFFNVEHAEFWGLLIFLLNFIPTIGSIVAITLTLIVISVQFTAFGPYIATGVLLIAIQFIIGNIVEPKLTGANLNLSPLIILLSLALWGKLWGVFGMFLCVPIMTILNIVLARFEQTRPFAILLTADGKLPIHGDAT